MRYYRVSRNEYATGDRIWETGVDEKRHKNGHYNILLLLYYLLTKRDDRVTAALSNPTFSSAAIEAIFEFHRIGSFSKCPARFENMMVFTSLENARAFNKKFRAGQNYIYEVDSDEPSPFAGDMNLLDINPWQNAPYYWKGEMGGNPIRETILTDQYPVFVIRKVPIVEAS